jgi:hypothetical protein
MNITNPFFIKPPAYKPGALFSNLFDCLGGTALQSFLHIPFQFLRNIGVNGFRPIVSIPLKHLFAYTDAKSTTYAKILIHNNFQLNSSSDSFQ